MKIETCDKCKFWIKTPRYDSGACTSTKFIDFYDRKVDAPIDCLSYGDDFETGAKFGCIHWESGVSNEN